MHQQLQHDHALFGWALIIVSIIWAIGAWVAQGVYFEPWALIAFVGGIALVEIGRRKQEDRPEHD